MGHASLSSPRLPAMLVLIPALFLMTPGVSSLGKEIFACDFENDLCDLIQVRNDHFDWTRHHGSTDTPGTGPSKAYSGTYYIYVEATQHSNQVAFLKTPDLGYQGQACVTVAYHMRGSGIRGLRVLTSPDNDILWYIPGNQGDRWWVRADQVNLDYGSQIQLQGYIGRSYTGDIAVDDLVITEGSCKEEVSLPYHCSFETGWCGMTQGYDDQFDWTRYNRSTGSPNTGPRNASEGEWFIYIEASTSGIHNGYTAFIETPTFNHTGILCLRFHYHMYGYYTGTLAAFHTTSGASSNVFQQKGNKKNTWHSAAVTVRSFQPGDWITFGASRGNGYSGDIAVDNINIATGGCIFSLPYQCSFESGLCGMTQRLDDNFDWTRNDKSKYPSSSGPSEAYDGRWFIYINTYLLGLSNGDTALIETPTFNHTGTLCLRFDYHMYGYYIGTLTALHTTSGTPSNVFQQTGDQGNTWLSAAVDVSGFQPGDWITFSASQGGDYYGDIALDNINIATGRCIYCDSDNGNCQHSCIQEPTGDRCACRHGYLLESYTQCADIDECSEKTSGCSQHCNNTLGSFTCHCDDGFRLGIDNSTCEDIDECFENTTGCSQLCNNTAGGFNCHCNHGFRLGKDNRKCQVWQEEGSSAGIIAGAVAAAVAACLAIIVFILLIIRRRRQKADMEVEAYACVNVGRPRDLEMDTIDNGSSASPVSANEPSLEVQRPSQMYASVIPRSQRPKKADTHDKDRPAPSTAKPEISTLPLAPAEDARESEDITQTFSESVAEEQMDAIAPQCTVHDEEQRDDKSGLYYNLPPTATIRTSAFRAHVKKLQKNKGFEKEYKRLPSGKLSDWKAATRDGLKAKNRFKHIYPYDNNRVRLNTISGDPTSDYINASHIQGFSETVRYIASHGPTPLTKHDFWRMIWEQDVTVVVMVTNLLEDGTVRCVKYWPDKEEVMTYDDLTITLTKEDKLPDFTMRVWQVTKAGEGTRLVEQCHYTSWPDHGVAEDATSILRFHKRVRQRMKPGKPTVVHCSAGVGRTGTFIAIDYLLNQAEQAQSLDVYGCVSGLRHQRIQMVQTQSQYEFIHHTLVEALVIGDTTIACNSFHDQIKDMKLVIQQQFQYLDESKAAYAKGDFDLAKNEKNKAKNTKAHIIPRGSTRVVLTSHKQGRNDYINAVFVHSYHKRNAYIATQLPLSDTTIDFWRMIHDLRCDTIVLIGHTMAELLNGGLGVEHEIGKYHVTTTCPAGSPLGEDLQQTTVTVDKAFLPPTYANAEMMAQEDDDKAADTKHRVSCRVIVVPSPSSGYLSSATLTRLFAVTKDDGRSKKTFTVFVCRDGAALSGVAIACFSLFEMMPLEDAVDVFHVVKQIKDSRPEFISTLDQYSHLHDVAGEYIKQYGTYSNFR